MRERGRVPRVLNRLGFVCCDARYRTIDEKRPDVLPAVIYWPYRCVDAVRWQKRIRSADRPKR
jgi:hypothetical protein